MKKQILILLILIFGIFGLSKINAQGGGGGGGCVPPINNNCSNAISLTTGNLLCNQDANCTSLQAGECYISFSGSTETSMWYSFNATSSSMVLSFLQTNATNCAPYYIIYGPYTSVSAGCTNALSPSCSSSGTVIGQATPTNYVDGPIGGVYYNLLNGDPGNYLQLNNLNTTVGNNTYLIQMVNNECGGPLASFAQFCIGVYLPASNSTPSGANVINSCGTQYNGTTQGGYAPSNNGSPSLGNIDNNNSTTCPTSFGGGCGSSGNDVPFVINNPSYFTFCASANGTFQIQFDVGTCTQPRSGAQGAQMAILIGSASSMTLNQVAPDPMLPSTPIWTSSNFTLATGQCAYLVVDGFAGDMCTYSYTLNNVGGSGCVLPIELLSFSVSKLENLSILEWITVSERNNAYFTLEKSSDGLLFHTLAKIKGAGDSYNKQFYQYIDESPYRGTNYYRLSQTDYDGTTKIVGVVSVDFTNELKEIELKPNPTSDVSILSIPSYKEEECNIIVSDIAGSVIDKKDVYLHSGQNDFEINLSNAEKGIYFVSVKTRYSSKYFKIIKN